MKRFAIFFSLAAFVVALDQGVKAWVRANIPLGETREVFSGWVHWSHIVNHGAAWGVMSGQRWLLVIIALFVIGAVCLVARDLGRRSALSNVALGFILGGAIGNLIDRILFGAVTDFVDLDTPIEYLRTFPVWNIADSALTIGVILLLIDYARGAIAPVTNEVVANEVVERA